MWTLYQKAKTFSRLPSELLRVRDEWAGYCFDNAVNFFGVTIENALQERENRGTQKEPDWQPKYTLTQLLADDFRLPAPMRAEKADGLKSLMNLPGVKTVRVQKAG